MSDRENSRKSGEIQPISKHSQQDFAKGVVAGEVLKPLQRCFAIAGENWLVDRLSRPDYCPLGDGPTRRTRDSAAFSVKYHVWAIIGYDYRHIEVLPIERLTSEDYIDLCLNNVVDELNWRGYTLLHDRVSYHTTSDVTSFLSNAAVREVVLPVRSADGALIEQVWQLLYRELAKLGFRDAADDAEEKIIQAFNNLPTSTLNVLCDSYFQRWQRFLKAEGGQVDTHTCSGTRKRSRK
jgi:hypothetical protein